MSIKTITRVWDSGAYDGTRLTLVLALADWANDTGGDIFPTLKTMARKIRKAPRVVQYHLRALEGDGVLVVEAEAAGSRPRCYRLDLARLDAIGAEGAGGRQGSAEGAQSVAPPSLGVQPVAPPPETARGAIHGTKGVQSVAPLGCNPLHPQLVNRQLTNSRTRGSPVENSDGEAHPADPPGTEKTGLAPGERVRAPTDAELDREAALLVGFAEFESAYPLMRRRPRAKRAFEKALGKEGAVAIIQGARRYAAKVRNTPERFIAWPATWLDDEGWRDYADPSGDTPAAMAADDDFRLRQEATAARLKREAAERFRQWDAEGAPARETGAAEGAAETKE